MGDLITMDDLTNDDIHSILADAQRLLPVARGETYLPLLQGRILGNLFFEPSTRTRMSFETAMKRLGGDVVNLGDVKTSSVVKGETLFDTIQMVDGYTDIIAMRHPRQGALRRGRPPGSDVRPAARPRSVSQLFTFFFHFLLLYLLISVLKKTLIHKST